MLANQLAQPLSKKLIAALILISLGEDIALYLSRQSYFFEMIYTNIMLFSILIAVKLAPRLTHPEQPKRNLRTYYSLFVKGFVLLYIVSMINNIYSNIIYSDFSQDHSEIAADFSNRVESFSNNETEESATTRVFEWFDQIGYDFYEYFMAGLEEVWRYSYFVLLLALMKKLFPNRWEFYSKDPFMLITLFITSILFGIGHSLATEQTWSVFIGTVVTYTNMGLVLGYLLITLRNIWLMILIHGIYNVLTSMSWSYNKWTPEIFILALVLIQTIIWVIGKIKANKLTPIEFNSN